LVKLTNITSRCATAHHPYETVTAVRNRRINIKLSNLPRSINSIFGGDKKIRRNTKEVNRLTLSKEKRIPIRSDKETMKIQPIV
jgi:hypothetical protein